MNRTTQTALVAAAIAAAAATAQAAGYNGDLIVGFTGGGSANDLEYDLGSAASLTSGQTWNLGGSLGGFSLSGTSWGVIGAQAVSGRGQGWFSIDTGFVPNSIASNSKWSPINNSVGAIYTLFATAGAGNAATPSNTDDNSWNQQTINGSLTTQYHNVFDNPNIGSHNGTSSGSGSMDFYQISANGSAPVELGTFSLDGTGTLTFTAVAVPEPTTVSLWAGIGLLAISLRRVFRKA